MSDKTEFNDKRIITTEISSKLEFIEEERYRFMWEKMLKIEQIKKEDQKKNILRMTVRKPDLN